MADLGEDFALRVGLAKHAVVDGGEGDVALVGFGLDREGAARADEDVVDVTASQPDAVEDVPIGADGLEDRADFALALGAASGAIGYFLSVFARRASGRRYRLRSHDRFIGRKALDLKSRRFTGWRRSEVEHDVAGGA